MVEIGKKIKQLRWKLDLTQEELASRTDLTKGYISQLENDLSSPSIATLESILQVLGVSLEEFFSEPKSEKIVYKSSEYTYSQNGGGVSTWLVSNSQSKEMEQIILTLPEGAESEERYPFEGEEFGYVLEGKIEIISLKERYKLKKGDSFSIDGKKQHKIKNISKGESKILWVTTPSNF